MEMTMVAQVSAARMRGYETWNPASQRTMTEGFEEN
jgi:hypothetical protein